MASNVSMDYEYDHYEDSLPITTVVYLVVNVILLLLGMSGNGVVIWIAGLKEKKTVNSVWYLSLAVSDFIYCACQPFEITHMAKSWIFGRFLCKFTPFVQFLGMFSSIFLSVIISVDCCVVVMFPAWAQNHRTVFKATAVLTLPWVISAALNVPSFMFHDISSYSGINTCLTYMDDKSWIVSQLVFAFVIPFIIIPCYSIILLRTNPMTRCSKPFKILTALIAMLFVGVLPHYTLVLMVLHFVIGISHTWFLVSMTLLNANSSLKPFFYVFVGKDSKKNRCCGLFSRIESAIDEVFSASRPVDGNMSTTEDRSVFVMPAS